MSYPLDDPGINKLLDIVAPLGQGRFKRKERELNPQGSSLGRFRDGCHRPLACPSVVAAAAGIEPAIVSLTGSRLTIGPHRKKVRTVGFERHKRKRHTASDAGWPALRISDIRLRFQVALPVVIAASASILMRFAGTSAMHYIRLTLERCKWFAFHPRIIQKGRRKDKDFVVLLMQDNRGQRAYEEFTLFSERSPFVGKSTSPLTVNRNSFLLVRPDASVISPTQSAPFPCWEKYGHACCPLTWRAHSCLRRRPATDALPSGLPR